MRTTPITVRLADLERVKAVFDLLAEALADFDAAAPSQDFRRNYVETQLDRRWADEVRRALGQDV